MITHEQAAVLRLASQPTAHFHQMHLAGFISSPDAATAAINKRGREALAEYEAAHVTLTKDQLGEVFKAGYQDGLDDGIGGPYEANERWRLSNIWEDLQWEAAP